MCINSIVSLTQLAVASACLGTALAVGYRPLLKRAQRELADLGRRTRQAQLVTA